MQLPIAKQLGVGFNFSSTTTSEINMRFSIFLAIAMVAVFLFFCVRAAFGDNAVIVFGLLGFCGVLSFFKHVMNAN